MKKVLFPILALVLALSLALPMAVAPAAANAIVEPVILYGTELGGTADRIHVIDVANGTATPVFSPNFDSHANYVNGNAFDVKNHRLYYASSAKRLYFYDFDDNAQTYAGSMSALAACAAFYDGKYYYIVQGTDDLRAISLNPADGKVASDTAIWTNFTGGARSFAFGDIAITAEGILYGSTPTPPEFFSIDLITPTPTYTQVSTTGAVGLQLAFGCDGMLYGHKAGGDAAGDFYVVEPSDGTIGAAIANLNRFTDLASGPCPSLELTKTGSDYAHIGDVITYTYDVHNDGDVPLHTISVSDDLAGSANPVMTNGHNVGDADEDDLLDYCETWQFTASYTVDAADVDENDQVLNTATAYGYYSVCPDPFTDEDTATVDVLKPGIDVEKSTDEVAYFNGTGVIYHITVTNTGNCDLTVDVSDDVLGTIVEDLSLPEGGDETYDVPYTLTCPEDNYEYSLHSNVATAVGVDAIGGEATDCDCWTVIIFQWQPRTIGYWGNWDNHWSPEDMSTLVRFVNFQSDYFGYPRDGDTQTLTVATVHDLLLTPPERGKMGLGKATDLLERQLLAAWFSVKSYEGWTDSTPGEADTSMNPDATVYFDGVEISVIDLLHRIESGVIPGENVGDMLYAKDILDAMNNAENNNYEMFVDPDFDHEACSLTGDWDYQAFMTSPISSGPYNHDMTIATQDMDGSLSGTGGFPADESYTHTWNMTGSVTDGDVSITIVYLTGNPGYEVTVTGTVSDCGASMGGEWSSNTGQEGTWTATRA